LGKPTDGQRVMTSGMVITLKM